MDINEHHLGGKYRKPGNQALLFLPSRWHGPRQEEYRCGQNRSKLLPLRKTAF